MGKRLQIALATLLSVPFAFAATNTGIPQLNNVMETVFGIFGSFFNMNLPDRVWDGVVKGLFFLIYFAIYNWAGREYVWHGDRDKSGLGKRTANIVAFSLALISTYFTPSPFLSSVAGLYAVVAVSLLLLLIPGALVYIAFKKPSNGQPATAFRMFFGALLILLALFFIIIFKDKAFTLAGGRDMMSYGNMLLMIVSWAEIILSLLFIGRLIQALFNIGAGGSSGGPDSGIINKMTDWYKDRNKLNEAREQYKKDKFAREQDRVAAARQNPPGMLTAVDFTQAGPGQAKVTWSDATAGPDVAYYEVQISYADSESSSDFQPARPGPVYGAKEVTVNVSRPADKMKFRVRAVRSKGSSRMSDDLGGPWTYTPFKHLRPPAAYDFGAELAQLENAVSLAGGAVAAAQDQLLNNGIIDPAGRIVRVLYISRGPAEQATANAIYDTLNQTRTQLSQANNVMAAMRARTADFNRMPAISYARFVRASRDYTNITGRLSRLQIVSRNAIRP